MASANKTGLEKNQMEETRAAIKRKEVKGRCLFQSMFLGLKKRQVLTMRKPMAKINAIQATVTPQARTGSPPARCTMEAMTPAPAGIAIPTKYFLPGRPGLEGCGFSWMLKRARRLAPATRYRNVITPPSWI